MNLFDIQPFNVAISGSGDDVSVPMFKFDWDAENRLIRVGPILASSPPLARS